MTLEYRDGDRLVIQADLPGVDPERDIEIFISHHVLHIRASREDGPEPAEPSDLRYGAFARDIALPPGTEEGDILATYGNGRLEIRAPLGGHQHAVHIPVVRLEEQGTTPGRRGR